MSKQPESIEEAIANYKGSVSVSDELAAKSADFDISLESVSVELMPLNDLIARAHVEKVGSEIFVADVRQWSLRRMVCVSIVLVGRGWAEKLTALLYLSP